MNIYTDGSCKYHPRCGGYGIRFKWIEWNNDKLEEKILDHPIQMGIKGITPPQMELEAVIKALEEVLKMEVEQFEKLTVWTDSQYVTQNVKNAIFNWSVNHWRNRDKKPIQNAEQWERLIKIIDKVYKEKRRKVEIKWVKGHKDNEDNKAADRMAKEARKLVGNEIITFKKVRRKSFKDSFTKLNSVEMKGQELVIRILEEEFLNKSKTNRYRYEVLSDDSEFYTCIDFAYSDICLKVGHTYRVRFNNDKKYPQIIDIIQEIERNKDTIN
ncbi:MAG: hypothetical protein A2Y33_04030 [Spirochaetes bacterium GWF1_51_8]|nr:MAG: hypothetical protein A2Y33_04030 [Spirochaetes bacterium GWF1_51_8]